LAAITRYQSAVFGLLAIGALWSLARQQRAAAGRAAGWIALGAAPLILLQLWAWRVVYGSWLVFSYGAEGDRFNWGSPVLGSSLLSPWHGLYYWHPLLLLATAGLLVWAWHRQGRALLLTGVFGLMVYINAAWSCWWLASAFGNRAYDAALLPLMAGLTYLLGRAGHQSRRLLLTVCGMLILWNLYVLVLYRSGAIPRMDPLTWGEMIAAAKNLSEALRF